MLKPIHFKTLVYLLAVILVVGAAGALRWRAVEMLPIDYDEDDYLRAAQQYAALFRSGDWAGFTQTNYRPEHPPLNKILFGAALLTVPEAPLILDQPTSASPAAYLPPLQLRADRITSAVLGTLEVALMAITNPLAGFLLAIHTFTIKYTSQVMLEGLPALTSLACALCYVQFKRQRHQTHQRRSSMPPWLIVSAIFLGLTAASKYLYCVVGIAILIDWCWDTPHNPLDLFRTLKLAAPWGVIAIGLFLLANPFLWPDPLGRLKASVLFNTAYSQSTYVQQAGYPIWQPFVWLAMAIPWHPGVFVFSLDALISLLALFGLPRLWKKEPFYVFWLGTALVFLLVWSTKWPQYILILTAPLALAAAEGLAAVGTSLYSTLRSWFEKARTQPRRKIRWSEISHALPWLLPGLLGLGLLILYPLFYQVAMSLTDFNGASIRDGITGGVWRAVWQGITGQVQAASWSFSYQGQASGNLVNYLGLHIFSGLLSGDGSSLLIFELIWTVLSVSLQAVLGVGIALMLNRRGVRFAGWWQTIFILPWAIPEFIGALIWLRTFQPEIGWMGMLLPYGVNLSVAADWTPTIWLCVLLIAATWYGFPFIMLATSASLKFIPPEIYDIAAIDGAQGWKLFREVTWPMLMPLLVPTLIIRSIYAFNQFYLFYVMQSGYSTTTFATISYSLFTRANLYSVSAALNIITVIILILLLVGFNRWSKAAEGVTYAI